MPSPIINNRVFGGNNFSNDLSYSLGGTNEYFTAGSGLITKSNSFMVGAAATVTICTWVRRQSSGVAQFVIVGQDTGLAIDTFSVLWLATNKLTCYINESAINLKQLTTDNTFTSTTAFYFLTFTYNSATRALAIYIDGILQVVTTNDVGTGTITVPTSEAFSVGANSTGVLPDTRYQNIIAIYNTILSDADILVLYNGGKPFDYRKGPSSSNLQIYFIPRYLSPYDGTIFRWKNLIDSGDVLFSTNMEITDLTSVSP